MRSIGVWDKSYMPGLRGTSLGKQVIGIWVGGSVWDMDIGCALFQTCRYFFGL